MNPNADSARNVLKYTGQNYQFAPSYLRTRDPTSSDIRDPKNQGYYPLSSFWINRAVSPVNNQSNNLWALVGISSNLALWILLGNAISGPILQFSVPNGTTPIVPTSAGNITLTSSNSTVTITGSSASPNNHTIDFVVVGTGTPVEQFTTDDSLTETPSGTPPNITVHGANGLTTSKGSASQINVNLPVSSQGQVLVGSGTNNPSFSTTVLGAGVFNFTDSTPANLRVLKVENTDNTNAASSAELQILTGGTSAGNPKVHWGVLGATDWEAGINQADSQSWQLCQGVSLGTNVIIRSDRNNFYTNYPSQACVFAFVTTPTSNNTGDGTAYTVIFNSTSGQSGIDQRSNFNTGTGIFTAPITAFYRVDAMVVAQNIGIAHTAGILSLVVANGGGTLATYTSAYSNPATSADISQNYAMNCGAIIRMATGNTLKSVLTISNSTKTVGVFGAAAASPGSWISISMVA